MKVTIENLVYHIDNEYDNDVDTTQIHNVGNVSSQWGYYYAEHERENDVKEKKHKQLIFSV